MKRNILTIVVIALCLINLALSAVVVFSIVPMANRTNDLITQVASVINLELEDPNADSIVGNVPVADREELEAIGNGDTIQVNLKDNNAGTGMHVAMYDTVTLIVDKKAKDYKTVTGLIATSSNYILETVNTTLSQRTIDDMQEDVDRKELKSAIREKLNDYFSTTMICDVSVNNLKYQ